MALSVNSVLGFIGIAVVLSWESATFEVSSVNSVFGSVSICVVAG